MHVDIKLNYYYKLIFGVFSILCVSLCVDIMYANFMFLKFIVNWCEGAFNLNSAKITITTKAFLASVN